MDSNKKMVVRLGTCKLIRQLKKVRQTMKDNANVKVNKTKENLMKKKNQIGEKSEELGMKGHACWPSH